MKEIRISKVCLVLENCEAIDIPAEHINFISFRIKDTNYFSYNCQPVLHESKRADVFILGIKNLEKIMYTAGGSNKEESALNRLVRHADITNIEITLENGEIFQFYVPWGSNNRWINSYQSLDRIKNYEDTSYWRLEIRKRLTLKTLKANYKEFRQYLWMKIHRF